MEGWKVGMEPKDVFPTTALALHLNCPLLVWRSAGSRCKCRINNNWPVESYAYFQGWLEPRCRLLPNHNEINWLGINIPVLGSKRDVVGNLYPFICFALKKQIDGFAFSFSCVLLVSPIAFAHAAYFPAMQAEGYKPTPLEKTVALLSPRSPACILVLHDSDTKVRKCDFPYDAGNTLPSASEVLGLFDVCLCFRFPAYWTVMSHFLKHNGCFMLALYSLWQWFSKKSTYICNSCLE